MKSFNTTDRDSQIPKLAARDWERRESLATKQEAAETRQQAILQALDLAPHFDLHRLPQNFWVAVLTEERVGESQNFSDEIAGCTALHRISDHILFFRSNLPESELRENIDLSFLPF